MCVTDLCCMALKWNLEDGRKTWKTNEDMGRHTERRDGCELERLPAIVPDGDNSSPDVPLGTGETKSK